jgi:hypothetical protein
MTSKLLAFYTSPTYSTLMENLEAINTSLKQLFCHKQFVNTAVLLRATGGWRKVHEELHYLYSSPNIKTIKFKKDKMGSIGSNPQEMRNACKNLVGKPEGKRPLGRWENNIKMDVKRNSLRT